MRGYNFNVQYHSSAFVRAESINLGLQSIHDEFVNLVQTIFKVLVDPLNHIFFSDPCNGVGQYVTIWHLKVLVFDWNDLAAQILFASQSTVNLSNTDLV